MALLQRGIAPRYSETPLLGTLRRVLKVFVLTGVKFIESKKLTFKLQRTVNEYAAKRRIYKRPGQQKYTVSRHTEFCKADRTT